MKHLILVSSPQSVSRSFSACFPNTVGEGVLPEVPVSGLGGLLSKRVLSSQLSFTFPSLKFFFGGAVSPGSLRESSFSRKLANECARLLELMGADATCLSSHFFG